MKSTFDPIGYFSIQVCNMFSVLNRYKSKNPSMMFIGIIGKSTVFSSNFFINHKKRYKSNVRYDNISTITMAMAERSSLVM